MNDEIVYRIDLRDQASLATSLAGTVKQSLRAIDSGRRPSRLSALQLKQVDRMISLLLDSAQGSGIAPAAHLVADPTANRPRSQTERKGMYELVRRLVHKQTNEQVLAWVVCASTILTDMRSKGLARLPATEVQFVRAELEPFLRKLSDVDQDIDERGRSELSRIR